MTFRRKMPSQPYFARASGTIVNRGGCDSGGILHGLIDARHLGCPMPMLKAAVGLSCCEPGDVLEVWASDERTTREMMQLSVTRRLAMPEMTPTSDGSTAYRFVMKRATT